MSSKKPYYIFVLVLVLVFVLPVAVKAVTIDDLLETIADLERQIRELERELDRIIREAPVIDDFEQNLYFGLRNNDEVRKLQRFLIGENYFSPGLDTGNFLDLTRRAVIDFQRENDLPPTGYFGPLTRALINENLALLREEKLQMVGSEEPGIIGTDETVSVLEPDGYRADPRPAYNITHLEMMIHETINWKRAENGVPPLLWDDGVASVSRRHSENQAKDNEVLTNPDLSCHYPVIRHDGFEFGFKVGDRLESEDIAYRSAGENIAMLSFSKDLIYQYPSYRGPVVCPEVRKFFPGEGSEEERKNLYDAVIRESIEAVNKVFGVDWVNKRWMTEKEVAERVVEMWLNSPGHRENMLRSGFRYGGVGIAEVNEYFIITHKMVSK